MQGKAAGRLQYTMILSHTAFSSGNRHPMGRKSVEESFFMGGTIWRRRIMGYIPDQNRQDRFYRTEYRARQQDMLSVLYFFLVLLKNA